MADTDFDDFTLVTALQTTDLFLAQRGSGGINFTLATLFGNVPDGSVGTPGMRFINDQNTGLYRPASDVLGFVTGGSERARIDASGNVGVGTTSPVSRFNSVGNAAVITSSSGTASDLIAIMGGVPAVMGVAYSVPASVAWTAGAGTEMVLARDAGCDLTILTSSNNVSHINFADAAVERAGYVKYEHNNQRMLIGVEASARVIMSTTSLSPFSDNALSSGAGSNRWTVVYAVTGTINTSDEREKLWIEWREDRRTADRRIARRILDELGWFQWRNAVAEKGEDVARWHFGARAQRVWSIVADEGLCAPIIDDAAFGMIPDPDWQGPPPPAWLCYDVWDDEYEDVIGPVTLIEQQEVTRPLLGLYNKDGSPASVTEMVDVEVQTEGPTGEKRLARPAGNRFGFRLDQLGLLLDWSLHDRLVEQAARQDALDARLAALEAAA
jgi:hypothetical protein